MRISITIIISPHFKKWLLDQLLQKKDDGEVKRKKERNKRRRTPLMAVRKSKAQFNFSTFIAVSHEHSEHPHNNQRHSSGVLLLLLLFPQQVCNILKVS